MKYLIESARAVQDSTEVRSSTAINRERNLVEQLVVVIDTPGFGSVLPVFGGTKHPDAWQEWASSSPFPEVEGGNWTIRTDHDLADQLEMTYSADYVAFDPPPGWDGRQEGDFLVPKQDFAAGLRDGTYNG